MDSPEKVRPQEAFGITDFDSAKDFLFRRLTDTEKKLFGQEAGIERTQHWLDRLDTPQEDFIAIHIAGTSGKGSVSYMISAILNESGQKTGTILSPHVYDVRERMLIGLNHVEEDQFSDLTRAVIPHIATMEKTELGRPSYFETITGMAFKLFSDSEVDYGVIETGLGGRFDPTNSIKRRDKLAVISRLGLDHTHILGNTMSDIAWQKGGIIPKKGTAIALEPDSPEAKDVLIEIAKEKCSELIFVDPGVVIENIVSTPRGITFDFVSDDLEVKDIFIPVLGRFQAENAALSIATALQIAKRDGLEIDENTIRNALSNLYIPGRTEIISTETSPMIIDAAHNPQKMNAFFEAVDELDLPTKPLVVFGAKQTKEWKDFLQIAAERSDKIYFSEYFKEQSGYLGNFPVNANEMKKLANKKGYQVGGAFSAPIDALKSALSDAKDNQIVIVTGSMYMIGELREHLQAN